MGCNFPVLHRMRPEGLSQSSPGEDGLQPDQVVHPCSAGRPVSILSGRGWVATRDSPTSRAPRAASLNPLQARMGCNLPGMSPRCVLICLNPLRARMGCNVPESVRQRHSGSGLNPLRARMGCNVPYGAAQGMAIHPVSILSGRGWVATRASIACQVRWTDGLNPLRARMGCNSRQHKLGPERGFRTRKS